MLGTKKYALDIWGDTVNIAAYTFDLVRDDFAGDYRGKINAKGSVDMYFVRPAEPEICQGTFF